MSSDQIAVLSWWQMAGAMAVVFALLMLVLKGLQRWRPGMRRDRDVRLLSVHRLGPKRELQRLRVGDVVHTLYRQEGAMVQLGSEPWTPACDVRTDQCKTAGSTLARRLKGWMATAGGRSLEC